MKALRIASLSVLCLLAVLAAAILPVEAQLPLSPHQPMSHPSGNSVVLPLGDQSASEAAELEPADDLPSPSPFPDSAFTCRIGVGSSAPRAKGPDSDIPLLLKGFLPFTLWTGLLFLGLYLTLLVQNVSLLAGHRNSVPAKSLAGGSLTCMVLSPSVAAIPLAVTACVLTLTASWKTRRVTVPGTALILVLGSACTCAAFSMGLLMMTIGGLSPLRVLLGGLPF